MAYDVEITRQPMRAVFDLKGPNAAVAQWCGDHLPGFPQRPLSLTERAGRQLFHLGQEHWILSAPEQEEDALRAALRIETAPCGIALEMISDTLAFFTVTGPDAGQVMAVVTPLDLHPTVFAEDAACFTEGLGTKLLVLGATGGFCIAVDVSYAHWFGTYLTRIAS